MGGRITMSDEQLRPDPRFGDKTLAKFINCIMSDGKKSVAERVMYDAMDLIEDKLAKFEGEEKPKNSLEVFHLAISNAKPYLEVRSKRIGGANYQVPMQVKPRRQQSLAFRWIISSCRGEKGRPMAQKLSEEIFMCAQRSPNSKALNTREQTHRMAEANKAFAHFAK